MNRTCPECGLTTFSIDDLYCPGCRTFLTHDWQPAEPVDYQMVAGRLTSLLLQREAAPPTVEAATARTATEGPRPAKRPRLISDGKGAVSEAIQTLRKERAKLTWPNVATWMQDNVEGCESMSARTLRRWRDEEGWPASADDPAWG